MLDLSESPCHECKVCEDGAGNVVRIGVLLVVSFGTLGAAYVLLRASPRCERCDHLLWWNRHEPGPTPETPQDVAAV